MQEAEAFGFASVLQPMSRIARYKRRKMERFLSMAEYRALGNVLQEVENEMPQTVALLRLLIATGARGRDQRPALGVGEGSAGLPA
jgi:hypothetical protein